MLIKTPKRTTIPSLGDLNQGGSVDQNQAKSSENGAAVQTAEMSENGVVPQTAKSSPKNAAQSSKPRASVQKANVRDQVEKIRPQHKKKYVAPPTDARLGQGVGLTTLLQNNRAEELSSASHHLPVDPEIVLATQLNDTSNKRFIDDGFVAERWGIFRKGDIEGEKLRVRSSASGQEQHLLRFALKDFKESFTSHDDLQSIEGFVRLLGGKTSEHRVKNENPGWWDRNINPDTHGKTHLNTDVYMTEEAKTNVLQASRAQIMFARAQVQQQLEGLEQIPAWASPDPKLRAKACEMLENYDPQVHPGGKENDDGKYSNADYWHLTGRNAYDDIKHYEAAKHEAAVLYKARNGDDKALFEGFEKQAREGDYFGFVGTMRVLAGDEPVRLGRLELTGEDVHIKASGPGGEIAANPREAVEKIFKLRNSEVREKDLVNTHPFTMNNKIDLLVDGVNAFPEIFKAIDSAQKSINVSYFIFEDDKLGNQMADKLIAKAKAGVEVNMMIDGIGGRQMVPSARKIIDRMEAGGVKIIRNHVFDLTRSAEILNHPDHRKLVIVDGKIAFTGGMNVGDEYVERYHDIMIKVQGDAIEQMQAEWLTSWMHLGGKIDVNKQSSKEIRAQFLPEQKQDAGAMKARVIQAIPGEHAEIMQTYLRMIDEAKESILIENPYCTNPEVQEALIKAAQKKKPPIDITIILPGENDHGFSALAARAKYPEMMKAGIKVYEYPGFNHGKIMVVDGKKVTVGSSNLDDVALRHIYELNLVVEDEDFARKAAQEIFAVDVKKSIRMKPEDVSQLDMLQGTFFNMLHDFI